MVDGRRPIRVAFDAHVLGRRQGGNERYAVELASALAHRSDVEVIAYTDRGVSWPSASATPTIRPLRTRLPHVRIPLELPVRVRRDRADVLHVQFVAPPVSGAPVVTLIADLSFEDRPSDFPIATRLRLRTLVRLAARTSAAIIVPSQWTLDRLLALYGLDRAKVHLIPDAASPRFAPPNHPTSEPEGVPRTRGPAAGASRPTVLAIGRSSPRKNLPRLVEAVAHARRDGAGDLELLIVGERGSGPDAVDRTVTAVRGEGWVHRLGHVSDEELARLYGSVAVFAYPSLYEGFGLPVLEALAAGAVVVASDTTSIPEVAGDAAVLVDPTDTRALAEGIARAVNDRDLRERLRAAGPRRAAAFSWDRTAARTVDAYRAALER